MWKMRTLFSFSCKCYINVYHASRSALNVLATNCFNRWLCAIDSELIIEHRFAFSLLHLSITKLRVFNVGKGLIEVFWSALKIEVRFVSKSLTAVQRTF